PARQRAVPFAAVVDKPAQLPLWQLEIDQRQRHLGPGLLRNQPLDARERARLPRMGMLAANQIQDVPNQWRSDGGRVTEPIREQVIVLQNQPHDLISSFRKSRRIASPPKMARTPFECEMDSRGEK